MNKYEPKVMPDIVKNVQVWDSGFMLFFDETKLIFKANLQLTFDGPTGKLKSTEVL